MIRLLALLSISLVALQTASFAADGAPASPSAKLRVASVQMRSTRNLDQNVAAIAKHLETCARDGVQVAVFPECAVTGYFDKEFMKGITAEQLDAAERKLVDACRKNKIYAVVGTPHREGGKLYNSAIVVSPDRGVIERYHKIYLAEAWPDPGDHLSVFKIHGVPCSIIVCHDSRYPELVRLPVIAGARVVFYVSHESGVTSESKIEPYRAQIQARAVENGVFIVQANAPANEDTTGSHGQSRVIRPDGNIAREASVFREEMVAETLDLSQANGRFPVRSANSGPLGDWWRDGAKRVRMIEDKPAPETVRVAGIVLKWIRGDKEANFRRAEPMIREAAKNGAQIVVTTECFLDGYAIADKSIPLDQYRAMGEPIPDGKYFQRISDLARELKIHLVAGMLEADGDDRFNTAVFLAPDGSLAGKYRKQKLGHEIPRNTPGKLSIVHKTPYGKMGVMICADRTEQNIVRRFTEGGAEFLICPSGGMFGPKTNDPIVQARSKENGLPIVFVHPAEFLVTAPDGSIQSQLLLGDRLLIAKEQIGGKLDENRICYFDLPKAAPTSTNAGR